MTPRYEKDVLLTALTATVCLHFLVLFGLITAGSVSSENNYQPLAVMDFAHYDPSGGEPGGGESEEQSAEPALEPDGPLAPQKEPDITETPPEPEAPQTEASPEPELESEVIASESEDAVPLPPPIKVAEAKPKSKAKPKAARPAAPKVKPAKDAQSESGKSSGESNQGGGKGAGRSGTGGGGGKGNPNAMKAYASKITAKLNRLKKYPSAAAAKRVGGVVTVNFTLNRQGTVISSRMVKSSGSPALDQEVMALLKRCSPFSPMPKELPQNTVNLTVPINFNPPRR